MICQMCGKELSEGSMFCNFCGAKQQKEELKEEPKAEKMYCNQCNKEFDSDMMFCDECGMKLGPKETPKVSNCVKTPSTDGRLLQIDLASICPGNKPVGGTMYNGKVYFYEDRIETKVAMKEETEVFVRMEDIASVSKGTYLRIWTCLTITLKNGDTYTMAGAAAGSATIDRAIEIIKRNIV